MKSAYKRLTYNPMLIAAYSTMTKIIEAIKMPIERGMAKETVIHLPPWNTTKAIKE